jgi:hypothetical protein
MPKLTFYPVGNADTFVIDLAGGEKFIFDYANRRTGEDGDKRCDLPAELRKDLGDRTDYDVAVFTHLDLDHYDGTTDFFYLEHDKKFQAKNSDGKKRIKMNTMWVPAAVLTEDLEEEEEEESRDIQKEAWHRLENKSGILVFSRPDSLKDAIEGRGIKFDEVKHLIIDAGRTVPGYTQPKHGVEFWVHSPHASRQNDDELVDRNDHALVLLAAFKVGGVETKVQLFADVTHEVIADIVNVTKKHKNEARLEWNVFKVAHHSSYLSLGPDKGKTKTEPVDEVVWLFEEQGHTKGIIVSTSDPIPSGDTVQPPHRQAAKYYRDVAAGLEGQFKVTMEHPEESDPKPLVIDIGEAGAALAGEESGSADAGVANALTAGILRSATPASPQPAVRKEGGGRYA